MSSPHLKLDARQSQNLVLTPQMQQAIKLLQFNMLDLNDYMAGIMETNPFLENDRGHASDGLEDKNPTDTASDYEGDAFDAATHDGTCDGALDMTQEDHFDSEPSYQNYNSDYNYLDDSATDAPSLRDHIEQQLRIHFTDNRQIMIGQLVFDHINERGWLNNDIDGLSAELNIAKNLLEPVLNIMREFDPVGIFAYNLGDCLALQLKDKNRLDPSMLVLLDNIELVAAREYRKLMRLCQTDEDDLREMLKEIRALNPNPIAEFSVQTADMVVPDLYVKQNTRNQWYVELSPRAFISVRANHDYYHSMFGQANNKDDKQYLQQNWQEAKWMIRALTQRNNTIMRVGQAIIKRQIGFFRDGIDGLKPLVLKDIAQDVEMHESTISRTCSGKYMATPHGIFEMKYFFTNAINGDAEGLSTEAIRKRIKNLIDGEQKNKVYSDDAIVDVLQKENIDIARRTVAKYRDLMKIPSSAQRKRNKAALL